VLKHFWARGSIHNNWDEKQMGGTAAEIEMWDIGLIVTVR